MNETILNKKASFDFTLEDKLEAGIVLTGSEVKSVRAGSVSLTDSFVKIPAAEAFLVGVYIAPYKYALDPSYDPKRTRKLLLNKNEIEFLQSKLAASALTIVPTKVYTNHNLVKVEIAIASKKKKFDKRESLKKKAQDRETEGYLRTEKKNSQRARRMGQKK